jgi:hypothetical protein
MSSIEPVADQDCRALRIVHLNASFEAFGIVMDYLSRSQPYDQFELGNFGQAIRRQLRNGHHLVAMSGTAIVGYVGWMLTSQAIAEEWSHDRGVLKPDPEGKQDVAALTIVAVSDSRATTGLIRRARQINPRVRVYFKRQYQDKLRGARKASVLNFEPAASQQTEIKNVER